MWILSKFLWPVWTAYELLNPEQWAMSDKESKYLADQKAIVKWWWSINKPITGQQYRVTKPTGQGRTFSTLEEAYDFQDKNPQFREVHWIEDTNNQITREQYKANKAASPIKTTWVDDIKAVDKFQIDSTNKTIWWKDIWKMSVWDVVELDKTSQTTWWKITSVVDNVDWLDKAPIKMANKTDEVSTMFSKLKNLKQAPKFMLNIIKKNKYMATLAAWVGWLTWAWTELLWDDNQEEFDKQQAEWDKKANINPFTWEVETNSKAWDEQAEKTITETKQELIDSGKTIMEQVKAWELSKEEAREQMWVLKEFASYNFETSISDNLKMKWIDGSYENREKIAKAIWIEWYDWSYDQNIQMLDKLRYLKKDEISNLLGNKE